MTDRFAGKVVIGTILLAAALLFWFFVWPGSVWGAAFNERQRFVGDYDSVRVVLGKHFTDSSVLQADSAWVTPPKDTFVTVDKAYDWDFIYTYYSGGDSIGVKIFVKYTAGPATISSDNMWTIANYAEQVAADSHGTGPWTTGGAGSGVYTVDIYAFDTLGGTTTAVEGATVDFRLWGLGYPSHRTVYSGALGAGRIATNVGSLAVRVENNPFYIFPTDWDSLSWTTDYSDSIYGYLNMPAAATSPNYVRAYVDIGEGIIDSASGSMIPRTAIRLYLELVGSPTLNDGSWMIVPRRQVKSPDANGRVNFIIPANTVLTPEGSHYILSFRAYDGTQQITGELKKFIVDTIPDPLLILDATETW